MTASKTALETVTKAVHEILYPIEQQCMSIQKQNREFAAKVAQVAIAAMPSGWQTMETAPKDGTEIDLWVHGARYPDAFWGTDDIGEPAWIDDNAYVAAPDQPTHWMYPPGAPDTKVAALSEEPEAHG